MKKHILSLLVAVGLIGSATAETLFNSTYTASGGSAWYGWLGYSFHVGNSPIQVSSLGLPYYAADQGTSSFTVSLQTMDIVSGGSISANTSTISQNTLASTSVNPSGTGYTWSSINPVVLQANTDYILNSYPTGGFLQQGSPQYYYSWLSPEISQISLGSSDLYLSGSIIRSSYITFMYAGAAVIGGGVLSVGPNMQFNLYSTPAPTPDVVPDVVPEPSTYALFGIGAIGMLMVLRRKKTA